MPQVQGKPTPMDWKSYAARRKLDIKGWVVHNRFKTYSDVKAWCAAHDVAPPEMNVVRAHLLNRKRPVQQKESLPVKAPKKTSKRKSKKASE